MSYRIIAGDCVEALRELPENSIDAVVTDPPYGLSFMGKSWDYDVPTVATWAEVLRVLKPGGHLLSFFGSRTYHRGVVCIEDAGFKIRDCLMWLYGSGFPKSLDVSKAIDREAGAARGVVGVGRCGKTAGMQELGPTGFSDEGRFDITAPATDAAHRWNGWGTALKPAYEPIVLARKPLDGTVAATVQKHGTGAINIDACRIGRADDDVSGWSNTGSRESSNVAMSGKNYERPPKQDASGRWPANVLLDADAAALLDEQSGERGGGFGVLGAGALDGRTSYALPGQGQVVGYGDHGGASRFFYCAKASRSERERGLDDLDAVRRTDGRKTENHTGHLRTSARKNHHPTVKPLALMRYLVRLVTPPGGTVLDPFMGSGTTIIAAVEEGFDAIGIEREAEYVEIAERRIAAARPGLKEAA